MQYLYHDGDGFVFMDTATYDQLTFPDSRVGDAKDYLLEEQIATVALHEGNPLYIDLPASVELSHLHRAGPAGRPQHRRDQARHRGDRPADPGPAFFTTGEKVKVDTRTAEYLGRV